MKQTPRKVAADKGPASQSTEGLPFFRLGFRPFYFAASVFACLAIPMWVAVLLGWPRARWTFVSVQWHAHEMLFGFAATVIVGFLLTASRVWTGLATPRGPFLAAMLILWLGARIAAVAGPYAWYAIIDLALLPLVAAVLLDVLVRARNVRGLPLVGLLVLLSLANLGFHLSVMGIIGLPPMRSLYAGLASIVMIECVMAGRVIPAFTANATPGSRIKARRSLDIAALTSTALALCLWVLGTQGAATSAVLALAAVLQAWRCWSWQPWVTRGKPLLWALHLAYGWIPIGLALLALARIDLVADSIGVHALTVGATGGLVMAMITRTARGHTGRPLESSRSEAFAYLLVAAAALFRVSLPLFPGDLHALPLIGAAFAWSVAFALYLILYTPWLFRARLDGKDG